MRKLRPLMYIGNFILIVVLGTSLFNSMATSRAPEVGVLYTELEEVSLDLTAGDPLSMASFCPDFSVQPNQVVFHEDMIYCLGQSTEGVNCLYSLNPETGQWSELMSDAEDPAKSAESIWDNLQCVGGLLIWDQYTREDDFVSDRRFCLDIVTGEERESAFRHGKIYWWNDSFYTFSPKSQGADLVKLDNSGDIEIVAKDMFRYQDSEMLLDGMVGYLQGHGSWVFRYNLDKDRNLDKLLIEGYRPTGIQCSADYMACREHDGSVFIYFYETGKTYCVREADAEPPVDLALELRNSGLWMITDKEISLVTLPELEVRRVEIDDFTDYYVTEAGKLILSDRKGNCIAVCAR